MMTDRPLASAANQLDSRAARQTNADDDDAPSPAVASGARPPRRAAWLWSLLVVWVAIAVWRFNVIDSPPYFEYAMGLFAEANFLAEHGFDYERLFREARVGTGGSLVYGTSVLPTLLALVMRVAPNVQVVLVMAHLATFFCAAVVIVALWQILAPRGGRLVATATALALVTGPLFSTQIDMLGMDLPVAMCALLAAWCLSRERPLAAMAASLAAFLIKPTGVVVVLGLGGYFFLRLGAGMLARRGTWRSDAPLLAAAASVLALELVIYRAGGIHARLAGSRGSTPLWSGSWLVAPDLVLLFIATLAACGLWLAIWLVQQRRAARLPAATADRGTPALERLPPASDPLPPASAALAPDPRTRAAVPLAPATEPLAAESLPPAARRAAWLWPALARGLEAQRVVVFSLLTIIALLAAIGGYGYTTPHYYTTGAALLLLVVGTFCGRSRLARWMSPAALIGLAAFNVMNWQGDYFPPLNEVDQWSRGGDRSHAYLADHHSNIAAVRHLADQAAHVPIVAGHPFTYFLAYPRLGYVERPLSGYSTRPFESPHFRDVRALFDDLPDELILIHQSNVHTAVGYATIPPPGPSDELIYHDHLPSPTIVYRVRLAALAPSAAEREAWLLEHFWYEPQPPAGVALPIERRAALLADFGRGDLAVALFSRGLRDAPDDIALRTALAEQLAALERWEEAAGEWQAIVDRRDDEPQAWSQLARARARLGRYDDALAALDTALEFAPHDAGLRAARGSVLLASGDPRAAIAEFEAAVALEPDFELAIRQLEVARSALRTPSDSPPRAQGATDTAP